MRELLGAAAAALDQCRGFTALIGGDAGIGKTRLAAEFAGRMRADGVPVAWAACRQDGGAPPYWPWAQLLGRLGHAAALAVPEEGSPDLARFLLFESVADALRAAAPVLLVLDDLHWADDASLRLLDALGAHVGSAPVLVLATYRDTEPGGVGTVAAERRLVLSGLSAAELGPALTDATGETVPPDVLAALHRRTGGNPFFAAELVRLLRAEGTLDGAGARIVPGGVRAVLDRRLDRLPDATEAVLRAAAALDAGTTTGLDPALLAAVAGCTPAELADALAPAVDARLIGADAHRFPHALVSDTLTARTPPVQRLELHRRAAAVLADRAGTPADTAHQLLAAARLSGDPEEATAAATAAALAARTALERTAFEDAVGWLEAGLSVLPPGGPGRGELLCALGDAALAAGDPARARHAFASAADLARRDDRPALLAAAALGSTGGTTGFEVDLSDPDRVGLLEEALAALPASEAGLRSAVSARLSVALAFTGAERRRRELADDAVASARALGDPRVLADALAARCEALAGPDHVAERRAAATEIVGCAQQAHDRPRELLGRRLRIVALAEAGHWAPLDTEIDAYARVADQVRRPGLVWYVPLWRGTRAAMRGDAAAVERHRAELDGLVARSGSVNAELLAMTQHLCRATYEERPAEIRVLLDRFLTLSGHIPAAAYCSLALMHAVDGDCVRTGQLLEAYLEARASTARDSEWLPEMTQAAISAALTGHRAAAETVYAALAPYAGLFAVEGILAGTWGCVDAHLGRLARLLDRTADAERHEAAGRTLNAAAGAGILAWARSWTAAPAAPGPVGDAGTFRREGEAWTVAYAGRTAQLRDTKGVRDLAVLLARPGRDVAVHELTGSGPDGGEVELADRTAIDAYRRRLIDLEYDRSEAEAMHDPVRAARAAAERDALVDELAAVTGLGGRPRHAGSDAERRRKAVGNRIRQALARIEDVHPELGRHLRLSVRTGTFCRYEPDRPVRWSV